MDNVKNDRYYVEKILKDIRYIIEKTETITQNDLQANEMLCDSILFLDFRIHFGWIIIGVKCEDVAVIIS